MIEVKPGLIKESVETANQIIRAVIDSEIRLDEKKIREVIHAVATIKGGFLGILPSRKANVLERSISDKIL